MLVDVGPLMTAGGLSALVGLWVGRHGREADAARTDAEADKIRTESYGLIVGDLRAELDRVRGLLAATQERLAVSRRTLGEVARWVETVRAAAGEAGIVLPPVPELLEGE